MSFPEERKEEKYKNLEKYPSKLSNVMWLRVILALEVKDFAFLIMSNRLSNNVRKFLIKSSEQKICVVCLNLKFKRSTITELDNYHPLSQLPKF